MRSYRFEFGIEAKITTPEIFVEDMLGQAQEEDATPFLKQLFDVYSENLQGGMPEDMAKDEFCMAVLKNGCRLTLRQSLYQLSSQPIGPTGYRIGLSVAPVSVPVAEYTIPAEADVAGVDQSVDAVCTD